MLEKRDEGVLSAREEEEGHFQREKATVRFFLIWFSAGDEMTEAYLML